MTHPIWGNFLRLLLIKSCKFMSVLQSADVGIAALMERMKKLTEESKDQPSQEEMLKRFEKVETQSLESKKQSL